MPRGSLFPCRAVPGSYISVSQNASLPFLLSEQPKAHLEDSTEEHVWVGGQCEVPVLFESILHWRLQAQCLRRKSHSCGCRFAEPVKNMNTCTRQGVLGLMNIESWTTPSDHQSHTQELSASLYVIFISLLQSSLIRNLRLSESLKKNQLWNGIISITLLEGRNVSGGSMAEMFVQLKLGDQRYKSKVSSVNSLRRTMSLR